MIDIASKIKIFSDFQSPTISTDYLLHIKVGSPATDIYIASKKQSFQSPHLTGSVFWEDADLRINGLNEKLDIKDKKIYISNISITLSNFKIGWDSPDKKRISDILGHGYGTMVDLYIKTASCENLSDCIQLTSLKIIRLNYSQDSLSIKCEDAGQQGFYVDLPRAENILTEKNTFEPYYGNPIPILYGHLESAPATVYVEDYDSDEHISLNENIYEQNSIILLPDNSYLSDEINIMGVKDIVFNNLYDGMEYPDFMDRQYLESNNNDIVQVGIDNVSCSVLYYPYWNTNYGIKDKFYNALYGGYFSQYEPNIDHVRLLSKYEGEYTLLKNHALYVHSTSRFITSKGYGITTWAPNNPPGGSYEVGYIAHDAIEFSSGATGFKPPPGSLQQTDALYTRHCIWNTSWDQDLLDELLPYDITAFKHRFAAEVLSFEPFSGMNPYEEVHVGGEDVHYPTDVHIIGRLQVSIDSWYTPGANTSNNGILYMLGVPSGISMDSDYIYPWENSIGFDAIEALDNYSSKVGFPKEIAPDFEHNIYSGSGASSYWDANMLNLFAGTATRDAIFVARHIYPGYAEDNSIYTRRASGTRYLSYLHPWGLEDSHSYGILGTFMNSSYAGGGTSGVPPESLANDFDQLHSNEMTFYYMFDPGYTSVAQNPGNSLHYCEYTVNTWLKDNLRLRKTWAEAEIFTKDFFVNAKGRTIPAIQSNDYNYVAGVLEVKCEGGNPNPSGDTLNDSYLPEQQRHLESLYEVLSNKDYHRKYVENDLYELMIVTRYDDGYAYLYDMEVLDIKHTDDLVFAKEKFQSNEIYQHDGDWLNLEATFGNSSFTSPSNNFGWNIVFSAKTFGSFYTEDINGTGYSILGGTRLVYGKKIFSYSGSQIVVSGIEVLPDETYFDSDGVEILTNTPINIFNAINGCPADEVFTDTYLGYTTGYFNENTQDNSVIMLEKPAEIIKDLVLTEIAPSSASFDPMKFKQAMESETGINLAFSINEVENSRKILESICRQSRLFFRYRPRDGSPIIESIKDKYEGNDVASTIKIDNMLSYSFSKTKFEDLCIGGCVVRYGKSYVSGDLAKTTPMKTMTHDDILQMYKGFYQIEDESNHVLEYEAPYIQDLASAMKLRNYLFEMNKNQHTLIKFKLHIRDGLHFEVGDIVNFEGDAEYLSPYGQNITQTEAIVDQAVYPYFMITSVSKKPYEVEIEAYQLHELSPTSLSVTVLGDLTLDGLVTYKDRNLLIDYLAGTVELSEQQLLNADCNRDGHVTTADIAALQDLEDYDDSMEPTEQEAQGTLHAVLDISSGVLLGGQYVINFQDSPVILSGVNSYIEDAAEDDSEIALYDFIIKQDGITIFNFSSEENSFSWDIAGLGVEEGIYTVSLVVYGNYGQSSEPSEEKTISLMYGANIVTRVHLDALAVGGGELESVYYNESLREIMIPRLASVELLGESSYTEYEDGTIEQPPPNQIVSDYYFHGINVTNQSTKNYIENTLGESHPYQYGEVILSSHSQTPNINKVFHYSGYYIIWLFVTVTQGSLDYGSTAGSQGQPYISQFCFVATVGDIDQYTG